MRLEVEYLKTEPRPCSCTYSRGGINASGYYMDTHEGQLIVASCPHCDAILHHVSCWRWPISDTQCWLCTGDITIWARSIVNAL